MTIRAGIKAQEEGTSGRARPEQTGRFAGLISQSEAADQMQVSERLVRDAKMVKREAPAKHAEVQAGATVEMITPHQQSLEYFR